MLKCRKSAEAHFYLLIRRARKLYASESALGVDLDNTVYALDSSTVDLCLSLF